MSAAAEIMPQHLPANVESEAALLGALMYDNRLIDSIADMLRPHDFFEDVHGRIFSAIVDKAAAGQTANPITLKSLFDSDAALADVGGASYLAKLTGSGAVTIGARDFALDILELAKRRRLLCSLDEARSLGADYSKSTDDIAAIAEKALAEVQEQSGGGTKEVTAAQAISAHMTAIEKGLAPGVSSNIGPLDHAMGPVRPGDLQIIAGRPGMGKSILGTSIAKGAALQGHGVLLVSLEMKSDQLGMRLAADLCFDGHRGINFANIRDGTLTSEQFRQVIRASDAIADLPLMIVDPPQLRVGRLNSLVRRHARRFAAKGKKLELVIVDYLQLLDPDRQNDNRTVEVSHISRALKQCAKANDVGLIALAQLSRKVEEREEKRPRLADLRESGSIEQDADGVLFIYRPEYYLLQTEPPENSDKREKWESLLKACEGDIEFICAKRRQGQTGIRHGRFYGAFQTVRA